MTSAVNPMPNVLVVEDEMVLRMRAVDIVEDAGFNPVEANVRMLQAGPAAMRPRMRNGQPLPVDGTIEQYMDAGLFFVGTPDEVYRQLEQFHGETGGFGNLLMMGQAGELDHADTVDNLTRVARDVAPRLAELSESPLEVRYEAVG